MNNEKEKNMEHSKGTGLKKTDRVDPSLPTKETSMGALVIWNITKAKDINPDLELHTALRKAQKTLEQEGDVTAIVSQQPLDRHLSCALLAWQQLGHQDASSLCKFVEKRMKLEQAERLKLENGPKITKSTSKSPPSSASISKGSYMTCGGSFNSENYTNYYNTSQMGPVLMLPPEQKIVMHSQVKCSSHRCRNVQNAGKDLKKKIEQACCLEKGCMEKLGMLSKQSRELEARLNKLSRREQERVKLLERAEGAWRDLEIEYLRRHRAAIEREEDLTRKGNKILDERNSYKEICLKLVEQLKPRAEAAEKFREQLKELETQVCAAAVERLKLVDQVACQDAILAGIHCKATQQERDLQFKEDQARRKKQSKEGELESTSALLYDAERTMRAELNALRQQITNVSNELLAEDAKIEEMKQKIEDLQQEKAEITEDLEGCELACGKAMQSIIDDIKKKRETLEQLKEKVIECKCQLPQDAAVEVKRTASLAALCQCSPEDRALASCSCTSFRSQLLSDLLKDLFGGLQSELGSTTVQMPCQLLKCLEDRHNWDRASVTKTNLRNFFTKLLIGELDIAIANLIEKYHAKWVGGTCADIARTIPNEDELDSAGWQDRAIALKAQRLAGKLANQMYEEKAAELIQRAKDIVAMGPPPCDCKPPTTTSKDSAVYRCMIQPGSSLVHPGMSKLQARTAYSYWQRTHNDVSCLRAQIAELQKETIRKGDLKNMEKNIVKLVQRASVPEEKLDKHSLPKTDQLKALNNISELDKSIKDTIMLDGGFTPSKIIYIEKSANNDITEKDIFNNKLAPGKKTVKSNKRKKSPDKSPTKFLKRQYAVNVCFCGSHRGKDKLPKLAPAKPKIPENIKRKESETSMKQKSAKESFKEVKQDNSIKKNICGADCACFNTVPSCSSIDELMNTLTKWKSDLNDLPYNLNKDYTEKYPILKKRNDLVPSNSVTKLKNDSKKDSVKVTSGSKSQNSDRIAKTDKSKISQVSRNDNIVLSVTHNVPNDVYDPKLSPPTMTTVESEYIGAVNLEKSNDHFCKCVLNSSTKEQTSTVDQTAINCYSSNKYILSGSIHGTHKDKNKKITEGITSPRNVLNPSENFNSTSLKESLMVKVTTTPAISSTSMYADKDQDQKDNSCDKPSQLSVCDCGYEINFLGVTLANVNSNCKMVNASKEFNHAKPNKPIQYSINCYPPISMEDSELQNYKQNNDTMCSPEQICQCSEKLDELKAFFTAALKIDIKHSNQDKSLDTKSFMFNLKNEREECVCCESNIAKESSDLEVNTFHLLEDHLKKKFEEFKGTCQYLPNETIPFEEDKIYTTILQKIKQIISENTDRVVCKCSGETQPSGSWERAHGLLQEYLKSKINHIQCSCYSPNQSKDNILPDLTEKVCLLIENDFKRLKEICQCNNNKDESTKLNDIARVVENSVFDLPERDTNSVNFESASENMEKTESDKIMFKKSPLVMTQHTSVQIVPNLETKSCEALDKGDYLTKIEVETQKSDTNERQYLSELITCDILNDRKSIVESGTQPSNSESDLETIRISSSKQQLNERVMEIGKYTKNESVPFIGYTINCSCNLDLGHCVCSKSLVQEKNPEVENIWKTYTSDKKNNHNPSYIMKGATNIKTVDINCGRVTDYLLINNMPKTKTKTISKLCETNDYSDWNMTLKESWHNFNKKSRQNFTNTDDEDRLSWDTSGADDPSDWYECASQTGNEMSRNKSVHFPMDTFSIQRQPENVAENISNAPEVYDGCECSMVPICHVKMLVENIESKLVNAECTCDALDSQVCPVHSKRSFF